MSYAIVFGPDQQVTYHADSLVIHDSLPVRRPVQLAFLAAKEAGKALNGSHTMKSKI